MKKFVLFLSFGVFLTSCTAQFNSEAWKNAGNDLTSEDKTRKNMLDDLTANYLSNELTYKEVLNLLGDPFEEGMVSRVPRNIKIPDSLQSVSIFNQPKEKRQALYDLRDKWASKNVEEMYIMTYLVGWGFIDPIILNIHMKEDKVVDFWVSEN